MDDNNLVVIEGRKGKADGKESKGVLQLSERGQAMLPEKRLSKKELARFKEKILAEYAPEAIVTSIECLMDRSKKGDTYAIQLLAKIMGILEDKPQVAVQVNTNVTVGKGKGGRGAEALLREQQAMRIGSPSGRETVIDTTAKAD